MGSRGEFKERESGGGGGGGGGGEGERTGRMWPE